MYYETKSTFVMFIAFLILGICWVLTLGFQTLYINGNPYGGWGERWLKRRREKREAFIREVIKEIMGEKYLHNLK